MYELMAHQKRSLQIVVGATTYDVWIKMLRQLVPGGRTHRIAPLVASFLLYATSVAEAQAEAEPEEGSVAQSLLYASELDDEDGIRNELGDVTEQLFLDAGVAYERTNSRGRGYSIVEEVWNEYLHWYDMPWE